MDQLTVTRPHRKNLFTTGQELQTMLRMKTLIQVTHYEGMATGIHVHSIAIIAGKIGETSYRWHETIKSQVHSHARAFFLEPVRGDEE